MFSHVLLCHVMSSVFIGVVGDEMETQSFSSLSSLQGSVKEEEVRKKKDVEEEDKEEINLYMHIHKEEIHVHMHAYMRTLCYSQQPTEYNNM